MAAVRMAAMADSILRGTRRAPTPVCASPSFSQPCSAYMMPLSLFHTIGSFPHTHKPPSIHCCSIAQPNSVAGRHRNLHPQFNLLPLPPPPTTTSISTVIPYLWKLATGDSAVGWRLVVALILLIGGKATGLAGPFFLKWAMDNLSSTTNILQHKKLGNGIILALVLSAISKAVSAGLHELRYLIFAPLGHATGRRVGVQLLEHILNLDLTFHLDQSTGVLSRILDRAQRSVVHMFRAVVFTFLPTLIELVFVCLLLAKQVNTSVAVIVVLTFTAYIIWTVEITKASESSRKQANKLEEQVTGKAVDALLNFETVVQFNNQGMEVLQYDRYLHTHQNAMMELEHLAVALNAGQATILAIGIAAVMALTGMSVMHGTMSIGALVLANGLILQVSGPLQFLGYLYRELRQSLVDLDSLFSIFSTNSELKDGHIELQCSGNGLKLRAYNLHYGYNNSKKVLHGVSLAADPGQSVAIVGPSGSGKSTIVKLLLRLYDPDMGSLFYDNYDLRSLTQASLRRAVAIVPQDTVLFNDTIFYNIAYSKPTATEAEVIKASQQARLHEAVSKMPQGYDTIVGERGLKLSGGEKQRVAIARAFLKAPRLLICDEATSALDSSTEAGILKSLKELATGRTCIFVAHRLSTIMHCDKILVMEAGLIIEEGTHQDLLQRGGMYASMWALQESEVKTRKMTRL